MTKNISDIYEIVKGESINLTKNFPEIHSLKIGLRWNAKSSFFLKNQKIDLDATAILLNSDREVRSSDDYIFYNQLESKCGAIKHNGDNRTGSEYGYGNQEIVTISLDKIPSDIVYIIFIATVNKAEERHQNFEKCKNVSIRFANAISDKDIAVYNISGNSRGTAMICGEFYRIENEWLFKRLVLTLKNN